MFAFVQNHINNKSCSRLITIAYKSFKPPLISLQFDSKQLSVEVDLKSMKSNIKLFWTSSNSAVWKKEFTPAVFPDILYWSIILTWESTQCKQNTFVCKNKNKNIRFVTFLQIFILLASLIILCALNSQARSFKSLELKNWVQKQPIKDPNMRRFLYLCHPKPP